MEKLTSLLCVIGCAVATSGVRRSDPVGTGSGTHTGVVQVQSEVIQQLQARLDAQENLLAQYASRLDALERTHQTVAFFADFGKEPFGEVQLSHDSPVVFNRLLLNDGHGYDEASGIFTAPVSGLYSFTLHIMAPDSAERGAVEVGIFTNSTTSPQAVAVSEGGRDSNDQGSCTAILHLAQGDTVYAMRNDIASDDYLWGSYFTSFMGVLVSAD